MRQAIRRWRPALALAVGVAILVIPAAEPAAAIETARGYSQPIYTQSITEEYRVPTEHGTIYGVVRRPVVPEGVKVPVILTYSPYNVQSRPANLPNPSLTDTYANYYVPRGYGRAVFDLVGTRESAGCYDFGGIRERETGAALVDYLGTRPWSNGKVGMIGGSYDGTTAYAAAIEAPEHLTTIVPQVAIDRWYDYPYHGGVRRLSGYGTPLLFDFAFAATPPTGVDDPDHVAEVATTRVVPCDRAEHQVRGYGYDPVYDSYWDERDYRALAHRVTASVLIEGGWRDTNVRLTGSTRFFQALPDDHPKKIVMGQWGHSTPNLSDWTNVRHAWFDYWLLGYDGKDDDDDLPDTGVMAIPRMDSVISGGPRVQQSHWPPVGTTETTLRLVDGPAQGPDELGLVTPSASFSTAGLPVQASEAMSGSCRGNCVTFLGAPLSEPVRIAGTPFLDLVARSTTGLRPVLPTVSTQYVAILFAQTSGGTRSVITTGLLNSRNRTSERTSEDAPDGDAYGGTLELTDHDYLVPGGARLGIAIASNVLYESAVADDDLPVTNEILTGGGGTTLRLPTTSSPGGVIVTPQG